MNQYNKINLTSDSTDALVRFFPEHAADILNIQFYSLLLYTVSYMVKSTVHVPAALTSHRG